MKKIVVIGGFSFTNDQKQRLEKLGAVTYVTEFSSADDWLSKAKGADVIMSDGDYLLENLPKLKNVFVTYPYIELGVFDSEQLKGNGVYVANTRGSNRESIIEWVVFATLALFRKFLKYTNAHGELEFERTESLEDKKALIVGKGDIGTRIGAILEALGMKVSYFQRGDNLQEKSKNIDLIVNCLSTNSSSKNLLGEKFFMSLSKGTYFVSFVRHHTYEVDAILKAIDAGILAGAVIDTDPEALFDTKNDFYRKLLGHKNVIVTPHVAAMTTKAGKNAADYIIENVEDYLAGKPQNILSKS